MDIYLKLFNTKKFVGSQPVTFNKDTYNPKLNYYTTHKLDGLRKLLLITDTKKGKIISSKMEVEDFVIPKRSILENTVLDCEFLPEQKKIYVFDILYYKGQDIRSKILKERLLFLQETLKILKSKKVLLKEYLSPYENSLCKNFYIIKNKYSKKMETGEVDGVIFTPDISYNTGVPLKWKPISLLSIDFKIKKIDDKNNKIALLTQSEETFKPKGKYSDIGIVKVSKEEYDKYSNGDVIEFIFENGKFKPIKIRKDKIKSNYIKVILSNFKTILNPPKMNKLIC